MSDIDNFSGYSVLLWIFIEVLNISVLYRLELRDLVGLVEIACWENSDVFGLDGYGESSYL